MGLLVDRPPGRILTITGATGNREWLWASPPWDDVNAPLPMSIRLFVIAVSGAQLVDLVCGPFKNVELLERLVFQSVSAWCNRSDADSRYIQPLDPSVTVGRAIPAQL